MFVLPQNTKAYMASLFYGKLVSHIFKELPVLYHIYRKKQALQVLEVRLQEVGLAFGLSRKEGLFELLKFSDF